MKRILKVSTLLLITLIMIGCNTMSKKIDTYLNGLELSVANDEKAMDAGESVLVYQRDVEDKYRSDLAIGEDQYKILTQGNSDQQKKFADIKSRIDILKSRLPAGDLPESSPEAIVVAKPTESEKPVENSIDKLLNSYESVVETYEKAANEGKLGVGDMVKISTKLAELKKKTDKAEMSPEQMTRLGNLTIRFTKVLEKIRK